MTETLTESKRDLGGWPKKEEEFRLYRDKDGSFMLVDLTEKNQGGLFGVVCNVLTGPEPSLCYSQVSRFYISNNWLKRFQWGDLPEEWKEAFTEYMTRGGDEFYPKKIRGFWRVRNKEFTG